MLGFAIALPNLLSRSLGTKKPPEGGHLCLVEAAGIEPASADPPPSDLHAYFIY